MGKAEDRIVCIALCLMLLPFPTVVKILEEMVRIDREGEHGYYG